MMTSLFTLLYNKMSLLVLLLSSSSSHYNYYNLLLSEVLTFMTVGGPCGDDSEESHGGVM